MPIDFHDDEEAFTLCNRSIEAVFSYSGMVTTTDRNKHTNTVMNLFKENP